MLHGEASTMMTEVLNPVELEQSISYAVLRLVRSWLKFKYNKTVTDFPVPCSARWDNSAIHTVLGRGKGTVVTLNTGDECRIKFVLGQHDYDSFHAVCKYVKGAPRASVLPPCIARSKNGEWMVVYNQGHGRLQGYTAKSTTDTVIIDEKNFDSGCAIFDVMITQYPSRCCFCIPMSTAPPLTPLFRSSHVDSTFTTAELDAQLLDTIDGDYGVLS